MHILGNCKEFYGSLNNFKELLRNIGNCKDSYEVRF